MTKLDLGVTMKNPIEGSIDSLNLACVSEFLEMRLDESSLCSFSRLGIRQWVI